MIHHEKWRHDKKSDAEIHYFKGDILKMIVKKEQVDPDSNNEKQLFHANVQTFKRTKKAKKIVSEYNFYWHWNKNLKQMGYSCWQRRNFWEAVSR